MAKKLIINQFEWTIGDREAADVVKQVRVAMQERTSAELLLLDAANKPVTVHLNGNLTPFVVVDLDDDPRPSEMY